MAATMSVMAQDRRQTNRVATPGSNEFTDIAFFSLHPTDASINQGVISLEARLAVEGAKRTGWPLSHCT
jgi:hypothetical protein